jgi:hypothetical protein
MSMQVDRKVITGGHIITMDAEYGELSQGALLIENGRIAALAENAKAFSSSGCRGDRCAWCDRVAGYDRQSSPHMDVVVSGDLRRYVVAGISGKYVFMGWGPW